MTNARVTKNLKKALPWTIFESLFNAAYSAGMVVMLGFLYDPASLGIATACLAITQLVEAGYATGIQEATIRTASAPTITTDTAHTLNCAFATGGMLLCWLIAAPLSWFYDNGSMLPMTILASLALPLNALFSTPVAIISRKMRARALTNRFISAKIFSAATLAVCGFLKLGAWGIILSTVASSLGSLLLINFAITRRPKFRFQKEDAKELIRFGFLNSLGQVCWMATPRIFGLLFGYFHGVDRLGSFQFALRLVDEFAALLQTTVTRVGLSYFASLHRSGAQMAAAFSTGSQILNIVAAPVFTGLALLAEDFVPTFFGSRWSEAIPYILILAISWVVTFPRMLLGPILKAQGRPGILMSSQVIKAVVTIVAVLVTGSLPTIYAVIGWGMAQFFLFPWGLYIARKYLAIPTLEQLKQMAPPFFAAGVMAICVRLIHAAMLNDNPELRIAVSILGGIASYAVTELLLDPGARQILKFLKLGKTIGKRA